MDYDQLKNYYIEKKMVMQHIHQPVMLKTFLQSKEYRASAEDIARQFLFNDAEIDNIRDGLAEGRLAVAVENN